MREQAILDAAAIERRLRRSQRITILLIVAGLINLAAAVIALIAISHGR